MWTVLAIVFAVAVLAYLVVRGAAEDEPQTIRTLSVPGGLDAARSRDNQQAKGGQSWKQ